MANTKRDEDEFREIPFFSTKEEIAAKRGKYSKNRFRYLQVIMKILPTNITLFNIKALVTEFQDTEDTDAKLQVLANLANFAYDPVK
jgi:hypothetical protein